MDTALSRNGEAAHEGEEAVLRRRRDLVRLRTSGLCLADVACVVHVVLVSQDSEYILHFQNDIL